MQTNLRDWPVITSYTGRNLLRVAMPLGGIGTGAVSVGGRGDLRDWEIMNRPGKDFSPWIYWENGTFFAVAARSQEGNVSVKTLEGPLDPAEYEGPGGPKGQNHGLPRFASCEFLAAYPLGQVKLASPGFPLEITLQAFNPLIPGDSAASGLPVAVLRYHVWNTTEVAQTVTICGTIPNFIGIDGSQHRLDNASKLMFSGDCKNSNEWRDKDGLRGIFMTSLHPDTRAESWGTIALTTPDKGKISKRLHWKNPNIWNSSLLDFWDDLCDDIMLEDRPDSGEEQPIASLALTREIAAGSEEHFTFLLTWHFPNRYDWTPERHRAEAAKKAWIGNYYCTRFLDAWDAAGQIAGQLPDLERRTVNYVSEFADSDFPQAIKEAALFNLSTLRCQTCFQTPDGNFFGFEGSLPWEGSCYGSCTHVWNYEQATAFLFGDLSRSMRRIEFAHATCDDGMMNFRVNLPLEQARDFGKAAADGQMGCIMKLYRDWQLCGDEEFLRALWPHARRALAFCWIEGGWDADRDGVMEGCQHNTMDVEYFGPNPQMTGWYLGALKAAERMAAHLGEREFAAECSRLFRSGSRWMDEHLFNGQYYIHQIVPPRGTVPECLYGGSGARDFSRPDFQLGEGCLVDQLVGQYMAHLCGLGYLHRPEHVRTALQTVFSLNRRAPLFDHFNKMRTFALGDEAALLMAAYPEGKRPAVPFPYYTEIMTGFEYTAAVGMLYEGLETEGLQCIADIRGRFDGAKRSPFNETECGYHYARAMASWAGILAWTGFRYSAVDQSLRVAPREGRFFWSNGRAWGAYALKRRAAGYDLELEVREGELALRCVAAGGLSLEGEWHLRSGGTRVTIVTLTDKGRLLPDVCLPLTERHDEAGEG